MKIRSGFVSNSSSSSFAIAGIYIGNFNNIDKIIFDKTKTYIMLGNYLEEGKDIIYLNEKLIKFFIDNKDNINVEDGDIYLLLDIAYDDEFELNIAELITAGYTKIKIINGTADQNSSGSIEDIKRNYME